MNVNCTVRSAASTLHVDWGMYMKYIRWKLVAESVIGITLESDPYAQLIQQYGGVDRHFHTMQFHRKKNALHRLLRQYENMPNASLRRLHIEKQVVCYNETMESSWHFGIYMHLH